MPESWHVLDGGERVSIDQLEPIARRLVTLAEACRVWFFYGEMGSGKTTLIKAIGKVLGVTDVMSSPTFGIVNEHSLPANRMLHHFDLYRLNSEKEVSDIGIEEYFDSDDYCLVEWPERLGNLATPAHLNIRITVVDPEHRKMEYQRV